MSCGWLRRAPWALLTTTLWSAACGSQDQPSRPDLGPPVIVELSWRVPLPVGGDPPIPGDPVQIQCVVSDPGGQSVTVTLTQTSRAGCLSAQSGCQNPVRASFPPGGTTAPRATFVAGFGSQAPTKAVFRCDAVDSRGREADARTTCVPVSYPAGAITCP